MLNAEKRWIRRIQNNGHEESANKLIHRYYKEIFAYTYRRVFDQETAMDLTQEIFMRTLQSIHQFDTKKSSFRTWLYIIAKNHCTDYFRSKQFQVIRQTDLQTDIEIEGEDEVILHVMEKERLNTILQLLAGVDEQERQIVLKKLMDDLTFVQIAEHLNIPVSTVKTKYYKGINYLKMELGGQR